MSGMSEAEVLDYVRTTHHVPEGYMWVMAPIDMAPAKWTASDPRVSTRATREKVDLGQVFAILQVHEPIPLDEWPWKTWNVALEGLNTDPYFTGVWEQPSPSVMHYLGEGSDYVKETAGEVLEYAEDAADQAKKALTSPWPWLAAGAVATVVATLYFRRK